MMKKRRNFYQPYRTRIKSEFYNFEFSQDKNNMLIVEITTQFIVLLKVFILF